ncbi:hypothetical protein TNCV_3013781 [Trichonephila clavipes]|nr:hypothetical protein TNCV_3013781 [Trichonephila clavipes]
MFETHRQNLILPFGLDNLHTALILHLFHLNKSSGGWCYDDDIKMTVQKCLHAEIVEVEIEVVSPSIVPSGNFAELNRTVTCMVLKANDRRTSCPCHDEFRGPRSDYVRQGSGSKATRISLLTIHCQEQRFYWTRGFLMAEKHFLSGEPRLRLVTTSGMALAWRRHYENKSLRRVVVAT